MEAVHTIHVVELSASQFAGYALCAGIVVLGEAGICTALVPLLHNIGRYVFVHCRIIR